MVAEKIQSSGGAKWMGLAEPQRKARAESNLIAVGQQPRFANASIAHPGGCLRSNQVGFALPNDHDVLPRKVTNDREFDGRTWDRLGLSEFHPTGS